MQREQAFKVEMVATVEGFDGDRAFVGNHWPVEISCHVMLNSVIVLQELGGGSLKGLLSLSSLYAPLHTYARMISDLPQC